MMWLNQSNFKLQTSNFKLISLTVLCIAACSGDDPNFIRIESGHFRSTITETGELQAVHHMTIAMPPFHWDYGRPKVTELAKEGLMVQKGDVIGQIETSGVTRALGQKQADLDIQRSDLAKMLVEHQTQIKQAEAEIQSVAAQLRMAQIGMEQVKFESPARQEIARIELEIAEIGLEKARKKVEATARIQEEDVRIQQAKIAQIQAAIRNAGRTLERFTLRAPADGMVEYRENRSTRNKVAVGDQFWPGQPILGLPDLSQMKVLTTVNETDVKKTHVGQSVSVRLDAFPKVAFNGTVTKISRISRTKEEKSLIKVFDIEVILEEADPILRPGMTVSGEFLVAELDDVLFVDPAGVHQDAGEYVVYIKDGAGLRRTPVMLGPRNPHAVVIRGPVQAGEQVALTPPQGEV